MDSTFGDLTVVPALSRKDLLAASTCAAIQSLSNSAEFGVAEIDPSFSDTSAFCERYKIGQDESANCVIIKATRGDRSWFATCVILATTKADVNGLARRHLDARKTSFAPMEEALALTGMEYGGVTPVGLPAGWPILIDKAVADTDRLIIGGGIRRSKLVVSGKTLASLPNAVVLEKLGERRE